MLYLHPGSDATSSYTPSYFYSDTLEDWVVFYLDAKTRSYAISTQLLVSGSAGAQLLTQAPPESHRGILGGLRTAAQDRSYQTDIHTSLPWSFSPRLLLEDAGTILVARSEVEGARLLGFVAEHIDESFSSQRLRLGNTGRKRHHFRWSRVDWARFCAKTALETLCLFEGSDKCLTPGFRLARDFVLLSPDRHGKEIVFDEGGPLSAEDTPTPVNADLSIAQNAPQPIPAILPHCEPGMHVVTLYEIRGWVLASVTFAGFPPSVLVLGGPNEHLSDLYQLIYDDVEARFHSIRLAYDESRPVIPVPVPGDHLLDLVETYRLTDV